MKHYRTEQEFQKEVHDYLESKYPGTIVMKQDPSYRQGFPDLGVFMSDGRWALLECKKSEKDFREHQQPNQEYYISDMKKRGFASFIYPEIKEEVFNALDVFIQES